MFDGIIKLQSAATFNSVDHNRFLRNIIRLSHWTATRSPSTGFSSAEETHSHNLYMILRKKNTRPIYMARETVFIRRRTSLHKAQTLHQFGYSAFGRTKPFESQTTHNQLEGKALLYWVLRPVLTETSDTGKSYWSESSAINIYKLWIYVSQLEKVYINIIFFVPNHFLLKSVQS